MKTPNICNIEEHELVSYWDLPDEVKPDFDWDIDQCGDYFFHHNTWYALGDFMAHPVTVQGFDNDGHPISFECHGAHGTGFFHAVLVRINRSGDGVIAADMYT